MTHVGPTYPTNGASADLHHWLLAIPKDPQKTRGHHAMTGKTGGKLPRYTVSIPYVPYLPSSSHGMLKYSPPTIIRLPFHGSVNPHLPFMDIYGLMTSPCFNHGTLKKKVPTGSTAKSLPACLSKCLFQRSSAEQLKSAEACAASASKHHVKHRTCICQEKCLAKIHQHQPAIGCGQEKLQETIGFWTSKNETNSGLPVFLMIFPSCSNRFLLTHG